MSWEALRWALAARAPSSASKLLLIIMANLHRPPANRIFAKAHTLADLAQMDRKTVLANLKRLEEAGLITRQPERALRGGAAVFALNVDPAGSDTENGPTSSDRPASEVMPDFPGSAPKSGTASGGSPVVEVIPVFPRSDTAFPTEVIPVLDPHTKHQLNQVRTKKTRVNKSRDLMSEFQDLLKGVDVQVLNDWQALRKQKRAPITETVLRDIGREAGKADMTMNDALTMACARGWQGFRADWVTGKAPGRGPSRHSGFDKADYAAGIGPNGELL